ncbi:uncharacterized protein LOC121776748 [Salvia splendens]|uniref:uncharacterized protein LOC121776748 n=1 Tax=Salvia splendens TaxID=180675 RepID=UPI001C28116D|nr:uncharacterized protein LOC121776748 [Salvia splendens]
MPKNSFLFPSFLSSRPVTSSHGDPPISNPSPSLFHLQFYHPRVTQVNTLALQSFSHIALHKKKKKRERDSEKEPRERGEGEVASILFQPQPSSILENFCRGCFGLISGWFRGCATTDGAAAPGGSSSSLTRQLRGGDEQQQPDPAAERRRRAAAAVSPAPQRRHPVFPTSSSSRGVSAQIFGSRADRGSGDCSVAAMAARNSDNSDRGTTSEILELPIWAREKRERREREGRQ